MDTTIDEIADQIYRVATFVPDAGMTFNQVLVVADEPLLFHTGTRSIFGSVTEAVARVLPLEQLRWISFGHVEADECGSLNQWLAAAPQAQVAFGALGCAVSVNDLADRPPLPLDDGAVLDLGGKQVRYLATPHVPHGWDAGLLHEETTGTLLCGDLFTQLGDGPALRVEFLKRFGEARAALHARLDAVGVRRAEHVLGQPVDLPLRRLFGAHDAAEYS